MPKTYDLKGEYERARQHVDANGFYTQRQAWDALLERRSPSASKDNAEDDYQTPELDKAQDDWIDGLVDPPTLIDVTLLSKDTQQNRKARDQVRLYMAATWKHDLNKNRWLDIARSEGQVRRGLEVEQLCWHPRHGYDDDDESMKKAGPQFFVRHIDLYGFAWMDYEQRIDLGIYSADIPVHQAQEVYQKRDDNGDLLYPTIDMVGNLGWVANPVGTDNENKTTAQKKIRVLYRDGRSLDGRRCPIPGCDHPQRTICVQMCGTEQPNSGAETIHEVDSPFRSCSFKITSARRRNSHDPHYAYRPPLYPMYVEAAEINHRETLLSQMVRKEYSGDGRALYLAASDVNADVTIGQEGQIKETYKMPEAGADEVPMLPSELRSVPSNISPHLMKQIDSSRERMQDFKPNRWLTGQAFEESQDVPATIGLQQAQGAAKPFNRLLEQQDATTQEVLEDIIHAIKYWDLGSTPATEHKYFVTALGDEDLLTGESEAGTEVAITASLLNSIRLELRLLTQSETLAEQNARYLAAKAKYDAGLLSFDDLLEASGVRDKERQKSKLLKDWVREKARPMQEKLILLGLQRTFASRTGMDLSGLDTMNAPAPVAQGGDTAHPSVQGITGRFMQTPMVDGVRGGNSPV
jgi:hypothetical protein